MTGEDLSQVLWQGEELMQEGLDCLGIVGAFFQRAESGNCSHYRTGDVFVVSRVWRQMAK